MLYLQLFGHHVSQPEILELFGPTEECQHFQAGHTMEAALTLQHHLQSTLQDLAVLLFGKGRNYVFKLIIEPFYFLFLNYSCSLFK